MAKSSDLFIRVFLVLVCLGSYPRSRDVKAAAVARTSARTSGQPSLREALHRIYTAEIGTREATGHNDGPRVETYQRYTGTRRGSNWCASFISWCFGQAGRRQPRTAWSPALFPAKRVIWRHTRAAKVSANTTGSPQTGDIFGVYFPELKRIAHCGFVAEWGATYLLTVEGNSENAVIRKRRPINSIYQVANWQH